MDINATENILATNMGLAGSRATAGAGSDGMADLLRADSAAENTRIQISQQSEQINELYNAVQATGNDAALAGLRDFFTTAASQFDQTAVNNLTQMGNAAFADNRGEFVTDLFANYNALTDTAEGANLAYNMVSEAGATFGDLGLGAAESFSNAADAILRAEMPEGSALGHREVLQNFTNTWRDARTTDAEDAERQNQLNALSQGVLDGNDTVEIDDFISNFSPSSS